MTTTTRKAATVPAPSEAPPSTPTIRTRTQVRAQARALVGADSRLPMAAADDVDNGVLAREGETVGELWLYGVVGGWWRGFDAESVSTALRGMDVDVLYVRIHSPGGYAEDGIAIGNLLRNHRARVVVVVDGLAASAASVIAIAGDHIVMCPGARLMLHDAAIFGWGSEADLLAVASYIGSCSENYATVYAHRAGGTSDSWRTVMTANGRWGTWYTAEQAVTAGLADEVGTVVAQGSPPVAPEDDFDDEDEWARAAHDLALLEQCVHPAASAVWRGEQPQGPSKPPRAHKPPTASADGITQPEGAAVVDFNDKQIADLRKVVGFADDADADTIVQATVQALEEAADDPAGGTASSQVPEGMTLVSKTVLDDVTAKAEQGSAAAEQLATMRTDAFLDKYKDRFPATEEARAKWGADYRRDPAGTEAYLKASASIVPTTEIGHGGDGENQPVAVTDEPGYKNWSF